MLYEVITLAGRHGAADGDAPHGEQEHLPGPEFERQRQQQRDEQDQQDNARITSYNVCYTKLLRAIREQPREHAHPE